MHKKHILFVLEYFAPHIGGVETLFSKIVDGVLAEGHNVSIVTCRYDQELAAKEQYADNCTIHRVGHNRFDFMWYGFQKANQLCHEKHIDLVHATTFIAAFPAGMLKWFTGLPIVLHVHEIYGKLRYRFLGGFMGFLSRIMEHMIFRMFSFDRYLCVSNYTKNNLRIVYGMSDKKLLTVYNAIDYDYRAPIGEATILREDYHLKGKNIVLFFGRPGVAKGLDDLVHAIPQAVENDPNTHFVLIIPQDTQKKVGLIRGTVDESKYEHILHKYKDNITQIPGARGDLLKLRIQTADLVVLPSHAEGFGFAIAEVCAMKRPLITTNVASIPEVVSGEVMFVEPGSPKQIAAMISDFFAGNAEIQHIPAKTFTRKRCIEQVLDVYTQLLTRKVK